MDPDSNVGAQIGRLQHLIWRRMEASASACGISGSQGQVLLFILRNPTVYQKDLEKAFHLRPSTATGLLKRMEKNGLLRRESCTEDARLKQLIPTQRGRELYSQVHQETERTEALLTNGVAPQDLETFFRVITQMQQNLMADCCKSIEIHNENEGG
ncbi:MAG TPA: MarR family transcriptional regulator [Candidatus Egerieicola faecale]|uniref:MarR family transcriptional regulator n=1 Tax=Candidatus Egerieicola faecale TaxID=2840774 RepID=A0A9D1LJW5_9FIRM|nr:MarR family transcriptional regulator [Candidatus Egerieicola faecale]